MNNISPLSGLQFNQRDVIQSLINNTFFADYGIVKAINADDTINVTHATKPSLINGTQLDPIVTHDVEVIYPASASLGIKWPLAVGDGVLLIGLKNYVASTNGIIEPLDAPTQFPHYTQNTMKAIPLQAVTNPTVQINVGDTGLLSIKNQTKSLYTIMNNMETHLNTLVLGLQTFTTGLNAGTLVAQAAAMATVAGTTLTNITQDVADLAALLEA